MSNAPNILVSNDDGINARGIKVLSEWAAEFGNVHIVAPDSQQSAASHAISLHHPLRATKFAPNAWAVDGSPADCVNLALNGLLPDRPDFVLAGINHGANLGNDVTYSGTVAVAREARLLGAPSIAFSMDDFKLRNVDKFEKQVKQILSMFFQETETVGTDSFLNVNLPAEPTNKPIAWAPLGRRVYGDAIVEKRDPRNRPYYWIGGDVLRSQQIENSDIALIAQGHITVTPLALDHTAYDKLAALKEHGLLEQQ